MAKDKTRQDNTGPAVPCDAVRDKPKVGTADMKFSKDLMLEHGKGTLNSN